MTDMGRRDHTLVSTFDTPYTIACDAFLQDVLLRAEEMLALAEEVS
jgi:hypothetical protein